ncbi:MAG: amidohydrolase family protein [Pseudorhodoplanes sp.]|uniref:amidohydrolase family protein n=1 Tax=Pseudorhodoplanes sp. TaxID=1934341 RepID=UPI003D0B1F27
MRPFQFNRRNALTGDATLAALGANGFDVSDGWTQTTARMPRTTLPERGDIVFRTAYVMTMDTAGDVSDADVHVRDGEIVAVGRQLNAPGADEIDGRGCIILPGLVETHWHMWNTLLRAMSGNEPRYGYFRSTAVLGQKYTPNDMYLGTRLAAAEAIHSGITHVHSWCHNIRSDEHAEADIQALKDSGLRARFSYGPRQGQPNDKAINLRNLERLSANWTLYSDDGLLTLGMAWRGQGGNNPATAVPESVWKEELEAGRALGLPISVHVSGSRAAAGQIDAIHKDRLLGKDMQLIHAAFASDRAIEAIAASGASVSLSPYSEMRIGFGLPRAMEFLAAGVPLGLSVDTVELTGNADMFGIMKLLQSVENAKSEDEFRLGARRVLSLATIEGARAMGISDTVGSVTVGKRADLIMVSTSDVNLGVFGDPAHMLVTAAQPANVDTVMVDGRVLKRGGKLTAFDGHEVAAEAAAASAALRRRANWPI